MENCRKGRFLRQKSIDKPTGAYYNVLAVCNKYISNRERQSLRHGYAVPPPFTQGRLSHLCVYRSIARLVRALRPSAAGGGYSEDEKA